MSKWKIPPFLRNCKLDFYIDWELKVKQVVTGVRLVTLSFGDYALIWWNTMLDDMKRGVIEPCERVQECGGVPPNLGRVKRPLWLDSSWDMVELQNYDTPRELVHQVMKIEMQLRRRNASRRSIIGSSS
ncbi:hypothetical protein CR513_27409, partial [Mucuna pruriens]